MEIRNYNTFFLFAILVFTFFTMFGNITQADEPAQEKAERLSPIWALEFSPDGKTLRYWKIPVGRTMGH